MLDLIRALAIIHVFLFHYYMEWFKGSFMLIPQGIWENLPRLEIFKDGGIIGFVKNLFSFLFFYGFSAVNVFLVVSGFVLTYSLLKNKAKNEQGGGAGKKESAADFVRKWLTYYYRKFKRILGPLYASVLIGILFLYSRNWLFPALGADPVFGTLDVLKMLFTPFLVFDYALVQKFNGDYWFVPLILQMYLLFPLLFYLLRKAGAAKFLLLLFVVCAGYRFYAAYFLDTVPIAVSWPAKNSYYLFSFFLPRIFEFGFGMAMGWLHFTKLDVIGYLGRARFFILGFLAAYAGYILLMYKWGWGLSDLLMGAGLFPLFLNLANWLAKSKFTAKVLKVTGEVSYPVYLLHHYFLNYLLIAFLSVAGWMGNETVFWLLMLPYSILSVGLGLAADYCGKALGKASAMWKQGWQGAPKLAPVLKSMKIRKK